MGRGKPGIKITVGDGKTILKAYKLKNGILYCHVEKEGIIKSNWGITFEKLDLMLPSFQPPDEDALKFMLRLDDQRGFISAIGVSFVREPEDIVKVRKCIENYYHHEFKYSKTNARLRCPYIIAKIETEAGAENIEKILDVADGAMIARGDLALQLSREEVPQKQKDIISLCNKRGKIAITATEMLASMEENIEPTRAEVNDVFNSIVDGTDAVMLSGETSSGKYPAQAVHYMNRITERAETYFEKIYSRKTSQNLQRIQVLREGSEKLIEDTTARLKERWQFYRKKGEKWASGLYHDKYKKSKEQGTTDRICAAACELVEEQEFKAIVASTASGRTIRMLSRFRPSVKLIGIIYDERCRRKLLLSNGVYPLSIGTKTPPADNTWKNPEAVFQRAAEHCIKDKLLNKGDRAVFVSGTPLGYYGQGKVNILQIKTFSIKSRKGVNNFTAK
ncbi:MAG: pyruvate kinase [Dehalococcoidales bacterium]